MARIGPLILAIFLPIGLPVSSADASGACHVDGTCAAAQGASMLQAKAQRGRIAVKENRTRKRAHAKHRRSRELLHNGKLSGAYDGNWMAGTFGTCTTFCNPPVKERAVECKNFWDGTATHACGHIKPISIEPCGCELEACDSTPPSNCTPTPEEQTPSLPGATPTAHNIYVGCFDLASDDLAGAGDFMDTTCMTYSGSGRCRSGLPFFRNNSAITADACSMFCLSKGLDIFGIVKESECRCGASILNAEIWHEENPKVDLMFDADSLTPNDEADICPLEVYRYIGFFNLGGIPLSLLKSNLKTSAYIDSIVAGHTIDPAEEEDKPDDSTWWPKWLR